MLWLFDHGADWADRIGDSLARPWRRLSQWCYRRYMAVRAGTDWRCECGDLNRGHEAFCFRCGAVGPDEGKR